MARKIRLNDTLPEMDVDTGPEQYMDSEEYLAAVNNGDKETPLPVHASYRHLKKFFEAYRLATAGWNLGDHMAIIRVIAGLTSKTNMTQKSQYPTLIAKGNGIVDRSALKNIPFACQNDGGYTYDSGGTVGPVVFTRGVIKWTEKDIGVHFGIDVNNASHVGSYIGGLHCNIVGANNAYFRKASLMEKDGTSTPIPGSIASFLAFAGAGGWAKTSPTHPNTPPGIRALTIAGILGDGRGDRRGLDDAIAKLKTTCKAWGHLVTSSSFQRKNLADKLKDMEEAVCSKVDKNPLTWQPSSFFMPHCFRYEGDKIDWKKTLDAVSAFSEKSMQNTYITLGAMGLYASEALVAKLCAPRFVRQFIVGDCIRKNTDPNVRFNHEKIEGSPIVRFPICESPDTNDCPVRGQRFGSAKLGLRFTTISAAEATSRSYGKKNTLVKDLRKTFKSTEHSFRFLGRGQNGLFCSTLDVQLPKDAYYWRSLTEAEDIERKKTSESVKRKATENTEKLAKKRRDAENSPAVLFEKRKYRVGNVVVTCGRLAAVTCGYTTFEEIDRYLISILKGSKKDAPEPAPQLIASLATIFFAEMPVDLVKEADAHFGTQRTLTLPSLKLAGFVGPDDKWTRLGTNNRAVHITAR